MFVLRLLFSIISVFCLTVQTCQAKPKAATTSGSANSKEKIVLSFPNKSCGKLFAIDSSADFKQGDLPSTLFAVARGNVSVPAGTLLQFDVGNAVIGDLSFLKSLNPKPIASVRFRMQEVADDQFQYLGCLTECLMIDADGTDLADGGLSSLNNLKKMRYLKVSRTSIRGDGLAALSGWNELTVLLMGSNDLKHGCLKKLPRLKKLWKLDLFSTGIGDSDLLDLKGMPALIELKIGRNNNITDKGIPALLAMPKLVLIDLSFTSVTLEGLLKLKAMPNLRQLTVDFEKLKPLGVYNLRRALPKCHLVNTLQHTSVPLDLFQP